MKVTISTKPLNNNSKTRGVGVYTRELVNSLQSSYPKDTFILSDQDPYKTNCDLVHYPFFDPFFLTLPLLKKKPTVVTIHDCIPLKFPEHFKPGKKGALKFILQKYSLKSVSHILTDSIASKKDINELLEIPLEKISVIPLAGSISRATKTIEEEIKNEYALPEKYLLYIGDINWNKNVVGLIRAFSALNKSTLHLVLVGKVFSDKPSIPEYREVMSAISESDSRDRIHLLGFVPTHHLPYIYRHATLYVQPSWYEGFGLPILEAMKEGCPVITSGNGSLREVGADAVFYSDPANFTQFVQDINYLLTHPSMLAKYSELGNLRAKDFSWEKTGRLTYEVYEKVLQTLTH